MDVDDFGWPYVTDRKMPLDADVHELPVPDSLLEVEEQVTIPAHSPCEIRSYWWYKFYGVDFTVYASHPRTGRKQEFKGELDLYKPQAYEIYIVPWN